MKKIFKTVAFVYLMLLCSITFAQTTGSGILATIEYKANQIEQNDIKVGELNRQNIETYSLESEKLAKLKKELRDLIAEKEVVLQDYRQGYFCGGCGVPRSQFKPGETFPHSGQKIVPASQEKIAAKAKEYDDRISKKQQELKEFEFGENEFIRKRADLDKQMNNLKQKSDTLRDEIIELSKRYRDAVVSEAKSITLNYVDPLLKITADKHYIEDRINIIAVKMEDLSKEETDAVQIAREKASKDIEEKKANLQSKINKNNALLVQLYNANLTRTSPLKTKLSELRNELDEIKRKLKRAAGKSEEDLQKIKDELLQTEKLIAETQIAIANFNNDYETQKVKIEAENKEMADKIWWEYTVNSAKLLDEAEAGTKKAYALRRKILTDAKITRTANLQQKGIQLIDETAAKRKIFMEYAADVDKERIRLLNACSKAGCSCYGIDTHGKVVSIWNSAEGCIGAMENLHSGSGAYYGCEEESAIYQGYYSSNIEKGFSDEDMAAFQRKKGKVRFDLITRKISD